MLILFFVIGLCAIGQIGVEADLAVYFEDVYVETLDPEYIDVDKTEFFIVEDSSGENTISTNITMIKTIPEECDAYFKLTGLSMGEYNVPTGVDLSMKICEMLDEPIVLGPFFSVIGFGDGGCPPKPGVYGRQGYTLPMESLPDDFPENKYRVLFEITLDGKPILKVSIFVDIQS